MGVVVDARGLRCPWPVLRLAKAMRDAACVELLADDPAASSEVAALALARGWRCEEQQGKFRVERSNP